MIRKALALLALLVCAPTFANNYVGDYAPSDTIDCNFGTVRPSTGASFTLGGTPAVSVYKDNGTTESTTGVTLTADFDTRTGLNHVRITTASDGTFYSAGSFFEVVITTGTVDSISVVGQPVCSFTLNKVSALRPTTAARTLDVASTGEAGLDITNVITCTGSVPALGIIDCGTAQAVTGTTLQLRSAANFDADSEIIGATCVIGSASTGAGQSRTVTAYTNATDTATVATWTTTPTGTITYVCFGTSSSTGSVSIASGGITSGSFASGAIDATAIATDAIGSAEIAADAIGSSEIATDAIGSAEVAASAIGASEIADGGITSTEFAAGAIDASAIATDAIGSAEVAATAASEIGTASATANLTAQGILTGTCSSGSATTCVDAALTQAAASQLQDRLICFSDSWCAMITTFTPASDTVTTTKSAPSTRASLTYTIFPSTAQ